MLSSSFFSPPPAILLTAAHVISCSAFGRNVNFLSKGITHMQLSTTPKLEFCFEYAESNNICIAGSILADVCITVTMSSLNQTYMLILPQIVQTSQAQLCHSQHYCLQNSVTKC